MEFWFCSSWIYLWTVIVLLRNISADSAPSPRYTIHFNRVNFDQAMQDCSPGVLTTLSTDQEVQEVLELVSKSLQNQKDFAIWVGLKKDKDKCVVSSRPLKGFKWMEDGSEETQVSLWAEEPENTCTNVRCAALKGTLDGSRATSWGLTSVSCKSSSYQFICKLRDRLTGQTPVKPTRPEPESVRPEPKPATPEPPKPASPEPPTPATPEPPKPASPEPPTPATPEPPKPVSPELPTPATREPPKPASPEPPTPEPTPATQKPEPATPKLPAEGPGPDQCEHPVSVSDRSIILDPDNKRRVQLECWSGVRLPLHCAGRPAAWRLLDGSPVNFTTACQPCEDGFQKDASGNCVDVDECSGGVLCRHACLNTEGFYRCVCSDEDGKYHDEDSSLCKNMTTNDDGGMLSGVLMPVVIAVVVLVLLVVVVTVMVKCCLMKQSKNRDVKRAEKMAMKSKDGDEEQRWL